MRSGSFLVVVGCFVLFSVIRLLTSLDCLGSSFCLDGFSLINVFIFWLIALF